MASWWPKQVSLTVNIYQVLTMSVLGVGRSPSRPRSCPPNVLVIELRYTTDGASPCRGKRANNQYQLRLLPLLEVPQHPILNLTEPLLKDFK